MELYELNLNQLIEVKLLRLNRPKMNMSTLPLNGVYNSIENLKRIDIDSEYDEESMYKESTLDNIETLQSINDKEGSLENKFKEFYLTDPASVSIDNMFQLSSNFGKILFCETLEALLIINNHSDREIKIKEFKIKISNEILEGFESMYRKTEYNLLSSQSVITIPANQFYNHKLKISADVMCKYSIEVDINYTSSYYLEEYAKHSANKIIKTITSNYFVEGSSNLVIKKYYKKFLFATNLPFKIKEKLVNDNMEKCYLEINLVNQSPYNLHVAEFSLIPDTEKIASSQNALNIINSQSNFINLVSKDQWKNFNMDTDEEINILFVLNNYKTVMSNVCWHNMFDSVNKYINYVIKNRLNNFNDLFVIYAVSKPEGNHIYVDQHFKIILQFVNKTSKNLKLKIATEKNSDREFDVIDIIEKDVVLNNINESVDVTLICISEMKGNNYSPRLIVTDDNSKKTLTFDKLFNFNCVKHVSLL